MVSEQYRIVEYDGRWFPEDKSSEGVWQIKGEYKTKAEAEKALEQIKGGKHEDI